MNWLNRFFLFLALFVIFVPWRFSLAAEDSETVEKAPTPEYVLEVPIGTTTRVTSFAEYIAVVYRFAVSLAGILAIAMIIVAGFDWIFAGGNEEKIGKAKERISGALWGLVIILLSYVLLRTINPALVSLKGAQIPKIIPPPEEISYGQGLCTWGVEDKEVTADQPKYTTTYTKTLGSEEQCVAQVGTQPVSDSRLYCYCYGFGFDSGVREQLEDATSELLTLITDCMPKKAKIENITVGRISSISDQNGFKNCQGENWTDPKCAHAQYSCHYGGRDKCNASYAVDFGDEEYACDLVRAARECNSEANIFTDRSLLKDCKEWESEVVDDDKHNDHIHISIPGCHCQ